MEKGAGHRPDQDHGYCNSERAGGAEQSRGTIRESVEHTRLFAKGRSIFHAFIIAKASENRPLGRALDTVAEAVNGHTINLYG
jgi:hypothetical protein